jgi:hypothetical protein
MKRIILSCLVLISFLYVNIYGQETPAEKGFKAISADVIKAQTGFLASDWTEGREAGERGEYLAGDYIASLLQLYGVSPGGDYPRARGFLSTPPVTQRTFFQNFTLLKTLPGEEQVLKVTLTDGAAVRTISFEKNIDFTIRTMGQSIEIEAPVVFTGYGFKNDRLKYNDFTNLEIKGKFILKISGVPGFARDRLTPEELSASSRDTENMLKNIGIAGIIEFNPASNTVGFQPVPDFLNMSPAEGKQRPGKPYVNYSIPGEKNPENFIRIIVSAKTANEILKGSGIVIDDYIKKAKTGKPESDSAIPLKTIFVKSDIITTAVPVRNVIGMIEGNDPNQVIVLGAHYDHEGMSEGYVWNGADDNASGTVGVLTIAKAIMATDKKPEKTIIFALWTAEEKGLLGSRYYVDNPGFPLDNLRLNVNFDMISRYVSEDEPNKVTMTYTSTYPGFKELTEGNLSKYGIGLDVVYEPADDPPGGSDHRSFVAVRVPVMRFKPGHREEYHTPDDEISTLDWDIMEKIIRISFANVWELANSNW